MPGKRKRQRHSGAPDSTTPVPPPSTPAERNRATRNTRSTAALLQGSQMPSKRRDRSKLPAVNGTGEHTQPRRQRLQTRQQKAAAGQTVRPATTDLIPKRRAPKRATMGSVVGSNSGAGSHSGGRKKRLGSVQPTSFTTASDLPDDVLLLIFQELQLHRCRAAQGACRAPQFELSSGRVTTFKWR